MKTDRKPPLAKSPMNVRSRRALRPTNINTPSRIPMGSSVKTQVKESEIRPEYNTVSCQLKALASMVQNELGVISAQSPGFANMNNNIENSLANLGSLSHFERGRFYDEYSARRNERLMKKHVGLETEEPKSVYNLGVKVESAMKKDSKKKTESLKKSISASYASVDRSEHPRYSLRSNAKKPPLPVPMYVNEEKATARKTTATRSRRK